MNSAVVISGISRLAVVLAKWAETLGTAQAEGRDITDAELAELKAERKAAVDSFLSD